MEWARGDRARLVPLRDLGGALIERPAWVLFHGKNLQSGQLGVAGLIDSALRFAPEALDGVLDGLSRWRVARDLASVGGLFSALSKLFSGWARYVASDKEVPEKLVAALLHKSGEVLPRAVADGDLRDEARAIIAYRSGTTDLNQHRLGAWWAAQWSSDERRAKLLALRPPLDAQSLFLDLVVLAVIGAHRMVRLMAQRGEVRAPPDLSVMSTAPTREVERPRGVEALVAPSEAKVEVRATAQPEAAGGYAEAASWWVDAHDWARGDSRILERLLGLADRFDRPMWPLVRFELNRLETTRNLRASEWSRLALATLLLEFHRCEPERYGGLLELLATEQVTLETCGRIWQCFDPMFSSWAKSLAGDAIERHHEARRLSELGEIVPWMTFEGARSEYDRDRQRDEQIHLSYGKDARPSAQSSWLGAYCAATTARNDVAHARSQRLEGVVLPIDLFRDILVFGALAALRFRRVLTETGPHRGGPPSVADVDCVRIGPWRLRPNGER
ncbi:MAG TPA: hypothetical protein PK095_06140 [Myxococcota bacterium]|nr:hypothetical protein [Myxococcota bacterium]